MLVENSNSRVKKTSKFGNVGLFTTEASDGIISDDSAGGMEDEVLNGMENFELAQRFFNGM